MASAGAVRWRYNRQWPLWGILLVAVNWLADSLLGTVVGRAFDLGAATAIFGMGIMFLYATIRRGVQLCRTGRLS
jgi:hypothetical protein